jgi:LDH2 family malate/lactate/ureidoglycolate dehydrogenase
MPQVPIEQIKMQVYAVIEKTGYFSEDEVQTLTDDILEGELQDKKTHALNTLPFFVANAGPRDKPKDIRETQSALYVDANSDHGVLVAVSTAKQLISKAKEQGVAVGYIANARPFLRPSFVANFIAEAEMVGLVVNSGGMPMMSHPYGVEPVVGTNPISYAIPTSEGAFTSDMATSERAWGEVARSFANGTALPGNGFKDKNGNVATLPNEAYTAMPMAGYKGFSLAFFIEIMCGSFIGMDIGGSRDDNTHRAQSRGIMIAVFNPEFTVGKDNFRKANSQFAKDLKQTDSNSVITLPGERSTQRRMQHLTDGYLDISDELWAEIKSLA